MARRSEAHVALLEDLMISVYLASFHQQSL
jgi:hypothetical protein